MHPDIVESLNTRASAHDAQEWECIENIDEFDLLKTQKVRGGQDYAVVARRGSDSNTESELAAMSLVAATIDYTAHRTLC